MLRLFQLAIVGLVSTLVLGQDQTVTTTITETATKTVAAVQTSVGYGMDPLKIVPIFNVASALVESNASNANSGQSYLAVRFKIPPTSPNPAAVALTGDFNSSRSNKENRFQVSTSARRASRKVNCTLAITVRYRDSPTTPPIAASKPVKLTSKYQVIGVEFSVSGDAKMQASFNVQCEKPSGGTSATPAVWIDDTTIREIVTT